MTYNIYISSGLIPGRVTSNNKKKHVSFDLNKKTSDEDKVFYDVTRIINKENCIKCDQKRARSKYDAEKENKRRINRILKIFEKNLLIVARVEKSVLNTENSLISDEMILHNVQLNKLSNDTVTTNTTNVSNTINLCNCNYQSKNKEQLSIKDEKKNATINLCILTIILVLFWYVIHYIKLFLSLK